MAADLSISVTQQNGTTVVQLAGELDMSTGFQLREALREVHGRVDFDMAQLTFIDASGLRVLVETARMNGGDAEDPGWIERVSALISAPPAARAPGVHPQARERLRAAVRPGQLLLGREPSSEMSETSRRIRQAFETHRPRHTKAASRERGA